VITILPLQNPIVQAKAWATLDWFSAGRATAVVAVGWLKEVFDLLGVPFHERGRMCDEYVQAMIALWTEDSPAFEGKYVSFRGVRFAPKPVQQPRLPLWFGGDAAGPLRRIAKWGDGWAPFLTPPEKFPETLDFIRSQPELDGRTLGVFFAIESMNIGAEHVALVDANTSGSWDVQRMVDLCGWLGRLGVTRLSSRCRHSVVSRPISIGCIGWARTSCRRLPRRRGNDIEGAPDSFNARSSRFPGSQRAKFLNRGVIPPSTLRSVPVMNEAPSETRNSTAAAISSARPQRRIGVISSIFFISG
jgi:hypothetical protein